MKKIRWNAKKFLCNKDDSISKALSAIFCNNSAGVNWEAVHDNMLPLVQFASEQEKMSSTTLTGNEPEIHHLSAQMQFVINRFLNMSDEAEKTIEMYHFKKQAKRGTKLLQALKEDPKHSQLTDFYIFLLDNWEDLKKWSTTHRLLADLTKLGKNWKDDSETRKKFLQIIENVSAD